MTDWTNYRWACPRCGARVGSNDLDDHGVCGACRHDKETKGKNDGQNNPMVSSEA